MNYVHTYTGDTEPGKLTKKQRQVIKDLQRGAVMCTTNQRTNVQICGAGVDYVIQGALFWRLYRKKLIGQQSRHPQDYVLTDLGKSIE